MKSSLTVQVLIQEYLNATQQYTYVCKDVESFQDNKKSVHNKLKQANNPKIYKKKLKKCSKKDIKIIAKNI